MAPVKYPYAYTEADKLKKKSANDVWNSVNKSQTCVQAMRSMGRRRYILLFL